MLSDPPTHTPIGIVWHDEGAWVHNARNRALWGVWRTDAWNPVFVAPVFTAFEFAAFETFGVGTWQARTVPAASGVASVVLLMVGLWSIVGARGALAGGLMLATNYVFVMWNRAALLESTMVMFMVASWAAYALAERRAGWGLAAGAAAGLAWFSKASAACFIAALAAETCLAWWLGQSSKERRHRTTVACYTLAGALGVVALAAIWLLWPYWSEYRFYNWEMSVLRKPAYTPRAIVDRASWLPLVQGTFARMWPVLAVGMLGAVVSAARWRHVASSERLLLFWLVIGLAELVVHDSGNERRYLMFVPVVIALAIVFLARRGVVRTGQLAAATWHGRIAGVGLVAALTYLVAGSGMRIVTEARVTAGDLSFAVRTAVVVALVVAVIAAWKWQPIVAGLATARIPATAVPVLAIVGIAWNVPDYTDWLAHRQALNYEASVAVGNHLAPGTLVLGKLANGLALENRIRPLFVGNGFGNYADRFRRDDAGYILTYDLPRIGYESSDGSELIQQILDRYPRRQIVATFQVDETPDPDRAVLVEKWPDR